MVRNLSHVLQQELHNLDKDPESSKLAMKALKSYVEDMDSKDIPRFLALVAETKGNTEYAFLLYEIVARTHGVSIVPRIGYIMHSIVEALGSNDAGFAALHEACAKLVQTIARYGIDPTDREDKKSCVIHFLCKPLSNCLMDSRESLSDGAAFCLKALVDLDYWRFASTEMANEVCVRAAGALEGKRTLLNSHMGLITALAKRNALVVDAYARLLLNAGLQILQDGVDEGDSEKGLSSIQMMNSLMKNVDPRSLFSELGNVIEEMEKYQSDQLGQINIAAYKCLLTAKRIVSGTGSDLAWSYDGSNNVLRDSGETYSTHSLSSLHECDSPYHSPFSRFQRSGENGSTLRSANRKLQRQENGESAEVIQGQSFNGSQTRSAMASPSRPLSPMIVDNFNIHSTPRNRVLYLEDQMDMNSRIRQKQFRKFLSPCSNTCSLASYDENGSRYANEDSQGKEYTSPDSVKFHNGSEDASPAEDILPHSREVIRQSKTESLEQSDRIIACSRGRYRLVLWVLLVMLTITTSSFLISNQGGKNGLVPT